MLFQNMVQLIENREGSCRRIFLKNQIFCRLLALLLINWILQSDWSWRQKHWAQSMAGSENRRCKGWELSWYGRLTPATGRMAQIKTTFVTDWMFVSPKLIHWNPNPISVQAGTWDPLLQRCRACTWTHLSLSNKIQWNYMGLKITVYMLI